MFEHGVEKSGAGKNTHIEIRDVVGTFFVSFNGVVQCTIDCSGHVLPTRTDRDVYVIAQCLSLIPCCLCSSRLQQSAQSFLVSLRTAHEFVGQALDPIHLELISALLSHAHLIAVLGHRDTRAPQRHEHGE